MPFVDAHQPGMLCWVELGTSDAAAAKTFYQKLFGWTVKEFPMSEDGTHTYSIFRHRDRDVAAAYTLMPHQQGVPPHWLPYVSVASVDETAGRVASLGGTMVSEPMDVMENGRMAVIQDPTGAMFSLWEARGHNGIGLANEPGALCWAEVMTTDPAKAQPFYTGLFGWNAESTSIGGSAYTLFKNGETPISGMAALPPEQQNVPSHWMVCFQVADCDATVAASAGLGATTLVPPADVPTIGRFAVLTDPQGAMFSILQGEQA